MTIVSMKLRKAKDSLAGCNNVGKWRDAVEKKGQSVSALTLVSCSEIARALSTSTARYLTMQRRPVSTARRVRGRRGGIRNYKWSGVRPVRGALGRAGNASQLNQIEPPDLSGMGSFTVTAEAGDTRGLGAFEFERPPKVGRVDHRWLLGGCFPIWARPAWP